jgi:hypothetical protein
MQDLVFITYWNEDLSANINKDLFKLHPQLIFTEVFKGSRPCLQSGCGTCLSGLNSRLMVAIRNENMCTFEVRVSHHWNSYLHWNIV